MLLNEPHVEEGYSKLYVRIDSISTVSINTVHIQTSWRFDWIRFLVYNIAMCAMYIIMYRFKKPLPKFTLNT